METFGLFAHLTVFAFLSFSTNFAFQLFALRKWPANIHSHDGNSPFIDKQIIRRLKFAIQNEWSVVVIVMFVSVLVGKDNRSFSMTYLLACIEKTIAERESE